MLHNLISDPYGLIPYQRRNSFFEDSAFPINTPESPETAIARRDSVEASRLLRGISRDNVSAKALETSSYIAKDYLSNVPAERLERSNGVKVSFKRNQRFFSQRDNGFDIDIDLK